MINIQFQCSDCNYKTTRKCHLQRHNQFIFGRITQDSITHTHICQHCDNKAPRKINHQTTQGKAAYLIFNLPQGGSHRRSYPHICPEDPSASAVSP